MVEDVGAAVVADLCGRIGRTGVVLLLSYFCYWPTCVKERGGECFSYFV